MRRREFLGTVAGAGIACAIPAVAAESKPALTNRQIAELFERACRGHLTNLLTRYGEGIDRTMFEREARDIVALEIGSLKRQAIETRVWWDQHRGQTAIGMQVNSDGRSALWQHWNVCDARRPKVFRQLTLTACDPEEADRILRERALPKKPDCSQDFGS